MSSGFIRLSFNRYAEDAALGAARPLTRPLAGAAFDLDRTSFTCISSLLLDGFGGCLRRLHHFSSIDFI